VSENSLRNGANHGLLIPAKALPGASGSVALERMRKRIIAAALTYTVVALSKKDDVACRYFQARGGFLVPARKNAGGVYHVEIEARRDIPCQMMNAWPGKQAVVREVGNAAAVPINSTQATANASFFRHSRDTSTWYHEVRNSPGSQGHSASWVSITSAGKTGTGEVLLERYP
jgi:hypothetical protein